LEKPEVEYRQVNLTVPGAQLIFSFFANSISKFDYFLKAAVAAAFDTLEGKPSFDYVFDFTGEVRLDRNEGVSL